MSYCNGCGVPHEGGCLRPPQTVAERLDSARTGDEFGNVILGLFRGLEREMDDE